MFGCFRKKKKKLKGQPPIDRRLSPQTDEQPLNSQYSIRVTQVKVTSFLSLSCYTVLTSFVI